jgi:voltage-gated potassium channel Kch
MRATWLFGVFLITVYFIDPGQAFGQARERKFTAKIKLVVTSKDDIKGLITSYITRELRTLRDVDVVDQFFGRGDEVGPQYLISILAMKIFTVGGNNTGVALSFVIKQPFENRIILENFLQPQVKDSILDVTDGLYYDGLHWLNTGPTNSLQDLCKVFVADFDSKVLEKDRTNFRLLVQAGMVRPDK